MRFGQAHSAPFGEPTRTVEYLRTEKKHNHVYCYVKPRVNYGDRYFGLYMNTNKMEHRYLKEGVESIFVLTPPWGADKASLLALNIGGVADPEYDAYLVAKTYEYNQSNKVTITSVFGYEVMTPVDNYTSNWSLTGLRYGVYCEPSTLTRCTIDISVSVSTGTDPIITLSANGIVIATGAGTGVVTLTGLISGTVTIDPSVVDFTGQIIIRWPETLQILRDITNPPSTVVGSMTFNKIDNVKWTEPDELPGSTYYYATRFVNDDGDAGTQSATQSIVITRKPNTVTGLAYVSGNYNDCIINFTYDIGYNVYVQDVGDERIDFDLPVVVTENSYGFQLPVLSYPGTVRVVVRSNDLGVEELNLNVLELEFDDAGQYVPPRPNPCVIDMARSTIADTTINLTILQSTDAEKVAADGFMVYYRPLGGSYSATEAGSGTFTRQRNKVNVGTFALNLGTVSGWYQVYVVEYAGSVTNASANEYNFFIGDTILVPAFTLQDSRG